MHPRHRKLRLKRTTVQGLTPPKAAQVVGGKEIVPGDTVGFFCTMEDCPSYAASGCNDTCDPYVCTDFCWETMEGPTCEGTCDPNLCV